MSYFIFSIGYFIHPMIMEVLGEVLALIIMIKDEEAFVIRMIQLIIFVIGFGGYAL
jgi:hypothetical protein